MPRRKRNRKKKVQGFVLPLPFMAGIVFASALALGYIRLGTDCDRLGQDLKALETANRNLSRRLLTEEYRWSRMNSAGNLEEALWKHGMVMGIPREDQIVRIVPGERAQGREDRVSEAPLLAQALRHE